MGLLQTNGIRLLKRKRGVVDPYAGNVVLLLKGDLSSLGANTTTTTNFTVPSINSTVTVNVSSSAWAAATRAIRIGGGGGNYIITAVPTGTQITIRNCGGTNNAGVGTTINSGATVSLSIIDSSPTPKLLDAFGNVGINTTIKKYGDSSLLFDGSGDYLRAASYSDSFAGDFTAEAWAYILTNNWNGVLFALNGNTEFTLGALNTPGLFRTTFRGTTIESSSPVPINSLFHLAFSRKGTASNNCKVFLNGNLLHQFTNNATLDIANNLLIGAFSSFQFFMNGYIDSMRWTKGVGRYATAFNPETDTYLN